MNKDTPIAFVTVKADPNPDYTEYYDHRGYITIPEKRILVSTFAQAVEVCVKFIYDNELGFGNWTGGKVYDATGKQIAHISYSGRVWEGESHPPKIGKEIKL